MKEQASRRETDETLIEYCPRQHRHRGSDRCLGCDRKSPERASIRPAKLWDLRREAYGVILSGLGSVDRILDAAEDYIAQDSYLYFNGENSGEHNRRISEYMVAVHQRFSDDYLILSADFIAFFESLSFDMAQAAYEGPPDDHEIFAAAIRKYRPLLLKQARKEITADGQVTRLRDLGRHLRLRRSPQATATEYDADDAL